MKSKPAQMLVNHVRDSKGRAFATVVAVGVDQVGAAICNSKDVYRKKFGISIAAGRAASGTRPQMKTTSSKAWKVAQAVVKMQNRALAYFGEKKADKAAKPAKRGRGRPLGSKNKKKGGK